MRTRRGDINAVEGDRPPPQDTGARPRRAVLERVIVPALALVLVLVTGSMWVSTRVTAPAGSAAEAISDFEAQLLRSHLELDKSHDPSTPTDTVAVMDPLRHAARLCDRRLADVSLDGRLTARYGHPCDGLPGLVAATESALAHDHGNDAREHEAYEEVFDAVFADAEALDASVAATLSRARAWNSRVQLVTAALLALLVLLIGVVARGHRRVTDQLAGELRHQATHDPLTGLVNRLALREMLDRAAAEERAIGVLFLDLDGFKRINDTAGHTTGDALLVALARRLGTLIRPQDTAVRLGGDEFAVVCLDADRATSLSVAERIVVGIRSPVLVEGQAFALTASAGVSSNAEDPAHGMDLEREADIAMFIAKAHGGDRAEAYHPRMHAEIVERLALTEELAAAVADGSIDVAYQPIVEVASGRVCRVEALARWHHPTRGTVPPDVFIGLAERAGLITELGDHVLNRACAQMRSWQERFPSAAAVGVAVNVSTLQLSADGFARSVGAAIDRHGLAAADLTIEVTEGALTGSHADAGVVLAELRRLGVRLAVDDFGTGHSSLSRLRHLRVDELKIDRSFITPLGEDGRAEPLVASIFALAASLDLEVVAEGVETSAHFAFLAGHGCHQAQGYLLSKPRSPEDCVELWADSSAGALPVPAPAAGTNDHLPTGSEDGLALEGMLRGLQGPSVMSDRPLLSSMLAKLADLTGLETTYLTRIDWDRGLQHIPSVHNSGEVLIPEGLEVPWSETVCRRMLTTGVAATNDVPVDFGDVPAAQRLELQTYVGVPVLAGDGTIYGTLCGVSRQAHEVDDDTLRLMEMFAAILSSHAEVSDENTA